jgi:hypothetical protein
VIPIFIKMGYNNKEGGNNMQKLLIIPLTVALLIGLSTVSTDFVKMNPLPEKPSPQVEVVEPSRGDEIRENIPIYDVPLEPELQRHIYRECERYDIVDDYALVLKLIKQESTYQADLVSNGNYGLMQINHIHLDWIASALGYTDMLDPYQNVSAGICILSGCLKDYEDPHMALMVYNKGKAGAKTFWNKGIYSTNYTNSIILTNLTILTNY